MPASIVRPGKNLRRNGNRLGAPADRVSEFPVSGAGSFPYGVGHDGRLACILDHFRQPPTRGACNECDLCFDPCHTLLPMTGSPLSLR
jgi:hypothetical protein